MKKVAQKLSFIVMLVMVLLTVCTSAFAESIDDVLKDCKLDRSRWKVVEWFKAEKFVRFYDSTSVTVTGPGQFDAVIYDYFYGKTCRQSNCAQVGSKHYHKEKWGFNTAKSTGTLRSFSLEDANDTLDAYEYPTSMQIATDLKRNSLEDKTMQKIKVSLKDDKKFTAEPKLSTDAKNTVNQPKIKGLAPLPMPIGAVDGEWTYMGRYISGGSSSSILEWETRLHPYTGSVETSGLYDVYFHHEHYEQVGNYEGRGCYVYSVGGHKSTSHYGCVLKIVPLNQNGLPFNQSGEKYGTILLSTHGGSKGAYGVGIQRLRIFDNVTHQLLVNITDYQQLNGGFQDYNFWKIRENSPYMNAMKMSDCPIQPYDGRHG